MTDIQREETEKAVGRRLEDEIGLDVKEERRQEAVPNATKAKPGKDDGRQERLKEQRKWEEAKTAADVAANWDRYQRPRRGAKRAATKPKVVAVNLLTSFTLIMTHYRSKWSKWVAWAAQVAF